MDISPAIRKIRQDELPSLLSLYRHLHPGDPELAVTTDVEHLWRRIFADSQSHYLVADVAGQIVSSCTLAIILNLTRGASANPWACRWWPAAARAVWNTGPTCCSKAKPTPSSPRAFSISAFTPSAT